MKILLVEDDRLHASYLKEVVLSALPETTEILIASNGYEAETIARNFNITSIVMDLRMKQRNGIEAARTIWSERPNTRILFWSNHSDDAYLRGVAQIVPTDVAYGYILKTATTEHMNLALRSVLVEGQVTIDREIHKIRNLQTNSNTTLSDIEYAILMDLALGLPDRVIAKRCSVSLRTVQNRLLLLYDKLDVAVIQEDEHEVNLNKRVRAVSSAITTRIINRESIEIAEKEFRTWLHERGYHYK